MKEHAPVPSAGECEAGTIDSTPEFDRVLASICADEGAVWLRELGLGMNRAFTQERTVSDIDTFERMCGVHLSLGSKHAIYNKLASAERRPATTSMSS